MRLENVHCAGKDFFCSCICRLRRKNKCVSYVFFLFVLGKPGDGYNAEANWPRLGEF
jgi:hypothetical protein